MHRGTIFVIDENLDVWKSTEFNGGMGLDCYGADLIPIFNKVKTVKEFQDMVIAFDKTHHNYQDEVMYYKADDEHFPYVSENGIEDFEYSKTDNQFKFFKDDNMEYIYTSDSNYIKNLSKKDINIVCGNGVYTLHPLQILVTDYDEGVNNSQISFGEKINKKLNIEQLDVAKYIPTPEQEKIKNKIVETLENFNFSVTYFGQNGVDFGFEMETWTDGGVNMIHNIMFDNFMDLFDIDKISEELYELYQNFSVDEEIDLYRQGEDYKQHFTIRDSLEDFEDYEKRLEDLSINFKSKCLSLTNKKNNLEKEQNKDEINY